MQDARFLTRVFAIDAVTCLACAALLGFGGESYAIGPDSSAVAGMYRQMAAQGARVINHSWGLSVEPTSAEEVIDRYRRCCREGFPTAPPGPGTAP